MTLKQAQSLYRKMSPLQAAGVRIRFYHKRVAGMDAEQATIEAVRDEMNGVALP